MDYGRETVTLLDIFQPLCAHTYGIAPCAALLGTTGNRKCYNTRFTCQDPDNYLPSDDPLTLRFAMRQEGLLQYGPLIPSMISLDTTPGAINLAAMDRDISALGSRETISVQIEDHQYSDHLVDPYRLERTEVGFDPFQDSGLAQAGSATTLTLHVAASVTDDFYTRRILRLTGGLGSGQERTITDYVGATRVATVATWDITPDGTTIYEVRTQVEPISVFTPYDSGTFWGKWLARNPFYSAYRCRVYNGYLGDDITEMRTRDYVIDRVEGPTNGQVTLVAKDLFSIIEDRKAVAPLASRGELSANISAVAGSATLNPAGIGALEYPASGHVVIGDECIGFTRVGDVLTFTQRGALGTAADTHDDDDLVQLVLTYTTELAVDIVYDLLLNYASLTTDELPKAEWDIALAQLANLYSTHIATPRPVAELIGELAEQAGFTIWPDVETSQIKVAALRAKVPTVTVNDSAWIVDGSYSQKRQDDRRVSQVWVYYGQKNPVENLDEPKNFHSREVTVDLNAEEDEEFGVPAIREVFSRWIPQFGRSFAQEVGERELAMFLIPPLEATFRLHASRNGQLALASYFSLEAFENQDDTGAILPVTLAPVEIERGENELEIRAQQVAFAAPDAGTGERQIFIENDAFNLNLRTIHDSLYAAPVGTETVRFIVVEGFTVGSTSTANPAMRTGSWPGGVALTLENHGRVQGHGGKGGDGSFSPPYAFPGQDGGTALIAEVAIDIDNLDGELWGGGGGGGAQQTGITGSGGAGTDPGLAGTGAIVLGNNGTSEAGGASRVDSDGGGAFGGAGGGPGLPGGTASGPGTDGAGGAAGKYIDGDALVTWVNNGDRRGNVA